MKILIATGVYPPESGGPATYSKLLEERLPALGFEVVVLPFRAVRHLPKLLRHVAYFWKCLHAARSVDVIYALDTVSVGLPAALAAKFSGKKFLVRVPGDYAWEQARQRFGVTDELDEFQTKKYGVRTEFLRTIQRFVVQSARAVVVPSFYMQHIVSLWGISLDKITVIYSSIDLNLQYELPARRPEGFLVVSSGRRVPWKHFDGIERAVARDSGWHFFLAENLPRAQALGWVKAADVFVINSTYEGLSYALVEAMALGTPVVATRVGGNPELVEGCGILIPPKDDDSLHSALKTIKNNPELVEENTKRALERVKQFDISLALENVVKLFKTI